jgi:hypothetical protein
MWREAPHLCFGLFVQLLMATAIDNPKTQNGYAILCFYSKERDR